MRITRRELIATLGVAGALEFSRRAANAQSKRILKFNIVANSLGIHIPYMGALNETLPGLGYGQPKIDRISRLETITQSVLSGSAEVGSGDAISGNIDLDKVIDVTLVAQALRQLDHA